MRRATRRVGAGAPTALLLLLLAMPAAGPAWSEDDDASETHMFFVGALTAPRWQFVGEVPPPVPPSHQSGWRPLFGGVLRDPVYVPGQVDELIELLKSAVQPWVWEEMEGAEIRALGEALLLVRARDDTLDALARYLAELESDVLRSVRVEVGSLRVEAGRTPPQDPAALAEALAGPSAGPFLSFVALTQQRVSSFRGREVAYVGDFDVEVAQESTISDPIVQVANLGLGVDAQIGLGGDGRRVTVDLDLHLSELAQPRSTAVGEQRTVEAPVFAGTYVDALVEATPGVWTSAGGDVGDGWAFFVRVTPAASTVLVATPLQLPRLVPSGADFAFRTFDVTDLAMTPRPRRSWPRHIMPSNYTPPEPPEMFEPASLFPTTELAALIRDLGGGEIWEDPAALTPLPFGGRLFCRHEPAVLAGVEQTLETLRRVSVPPLTTSAELLELPAALLPALNGSTDSPYLLTDGAKRTLAQALSDGRARRLDRATVIHHGGVPNAVSFGRHVTYLQDFEVEIAQGAAISNPVMLSFFSGLQLDVRASRTGDGRSVFLDVRVMRTRHEEPMRTGATPHGRIELPELDVFRVRTAFLVPLGKTVLVASQGDGEHSRILLLTTR